MRRLSPTPLALVFTCFAALAGGCFEDIPTPSGGDDTTTGDGDGDPSGDGDGAPSGDGDGAPSGDGDGSPSGDGDGDPTSAEQCDSGYACVPDPGPAWTGPFALREAAQGCGDAFPDIVESLFADLQVEEGSCECSCGAPNVTCSTVMNVIGYANTNCVSGQGFNVLGPNECYNTFSSSHGVALPAPSSTCGPGMVAPDLPEPSFATELVSCGGFVPGPDAACEAGALCVPEPGEGSLGGVCYSTAGDVSCPAGYPQKTLYATDFEDTRACPDSCSCSASGAVCTVSITGYAQDNCVSPQGVKSTDSGAEVCAAASTVVQSIRPGNVTVKDAGTCTPGNAALSGEVTAAGAVTVCCSG